MQPMFVNGVRLLLAEIGNLGQLLQSFRRTDDARLDFGWFIAAVCGIVVLWLGLRWFERLWAMRGLTSHDPWALFATLCDAHGLNRHERKLLRIAAAHNATACCRLFVDPDMLHQLATAKSETAADYAKLNRKLFGDG